MSRPDDQILVIFGASGDLMKRKLLPSLFELYVRDQLPEKFVILGVARTEYTDQKFRRLQQENLVKFARETTPEEKQVKEFLRLVYYLGFPSDEASAYPVLVDKIKELRQQHEIPDRIVFYFATPPQKYSVIAEALKKSGLSKTAEKEGFRRVIIEKPFGNDLETAQHLDHRLKNIFQEDEIFRIDHFLGKETVQNILVLRFANGIFEPLWNRNYIDHVDICALETLGIGNRGTYYEQAGALRDMIQNHLMQLLGFVAMEAPSSFDAELMRDEIAKVFRSLHPLAPDDVVCGQYVEGVMGGEKIEGYRDEKNVAPDSETETYVAMRFFIDNWRWGGVPFYFYTGKRLKQAKSEIIVHFKATPQHLFTGTCPGTSCNQLILKVDKEERISLKFGLKVPGTAFEVRQVSMDFNYSSLNNSYIADAYERLLLDAMWGDSTLYTRSDALELSWRFIDPVLQQWKEKKKIYFYPAGTEGPDERKTLFRPENQEPDVGGKKECTKE